MDITTTKTVLVDNQSYTISSVEEIEKYSIAITVDNPIIHIIFTIAGVSTTFNLDSTEFPFLLGTEIFYNKTTKEIKGYTYSDLTRFQNDNNYINLCICINLNTEILCHFETTKNTIITSNVPIIAVSSFGEYFNNNSQVIYRKACRKLKEAEIYNPVHIYSSAAMLEKQVDFLSNILQDILNTHPELLSKYKQDLDSIVAVGSSVDVLKLVSDKKEMRESQQRYFKARDEITKPDGVI
jgi:hypothetical protein